ncbi:ABC-2 transporter permease [Paenibacillus larvae]
MLINIVKKDLILVKKYLFIMLIFTTAAPLYLSSKLEFSSSGFIGFLLTVIIMEYILFMYVSKFEDKYKGAALICATPYTRNAFVKAKYLFIFVLFICSVIIHIITVSIAPSSMERLNIHTFGITFLVLSIFFGILIPVQFKFGYDKTRLISFVFVFLTPFILPVLIKWLQSHPVSLNTTLPFPQAIRAWVPCLISFVIGFISMFVSLKIYAKKDLS